MMRGPRVVVIGAGAAGLSTAMQLATMRTRSVTVLEMSHLAEGSSGLSAGIFNRQTIDPVELAMRSDGVRVFDDLESRGLLKLNRSGYIRLARTWEQWDRVRSAVEQGGMRETQLLTPAAIAERVPGIRVDDVVGGMFGPRDGHVDGADLCRAYLHEAKAGGVTYRPRTAVLGRHDRAGAITLATTDGDVEADVVINAAGSWLQEVGGLLGCAVPIDNQRHQACVVRVPSLSAYSLPAVQTYFPGSVDDAVYVRPEGRGQFIAGLHSYASHGPSAKPGEYLRSIDPGYLETLARQLLERFPGWTDASFEGGWTGLYPLSPDGRFIIGPDASEPRVVAVGGLGGVGLTVSPAAGRLAAEWAVHSGATTYDFAEQLLPGRFPSRRVVNA
jgi:sarcosine oxidase, subunit beta